MDPSGPSYHHGVIEISELMDRGSEELNWYNATTSYPDDKFKGKSLSNTRGNRAASLSLNSFQRFQTEIVCGLRAKHLHARNYFASVYSEPRALLSFFIGGGTEIPHFGLQLRLAPKDNTKAQDFVMLWTAWDDDGFDSPRTPIYPPPDAAKFTFSASLTNVNLVKVELDEHSAKACNGKSGAKAYEIRWTSHTFPQMVAGLDIPDAQLEQLFSAKQIDLLKQFRQMNQKDISLQVVTRIRRDEMEQNWRGMTGMPCPTLPPYPFYACRYVRQAKLFTMMKAIPPVTDSTIMAHHQRRLFGWQNMKGGGFDKENPELLQHTPTPFTKFINAREYETIRMIGLLREAEAQKQTATTQFDQFYEFDLFRASDVLETTDEGLDPYFYGVMEAKSVGRGDGEAQQMLEQDIPLPEAGTSVTISPQRRDDKNKLWEGVVVSSRGISSSIFKDKKKFNAICVRLRRPHIQESKGLSLRLAGYVTFGSPHPAIAQVRRAIRYAMWGNDHFAVARDNKMKRLLLAHDNSTIKYHRQEDLIDDQTRQFLKTAEKTRKRNAKQIEAIRSAFSDGSQWYNFLARVTGPPGTGKTAVTLEIAAHCLERKCPLLIVCASNYGLDVIADRIIQYMEENKISLKGLYRLGTDYRESHGMQMPRGSPAKDDEEDEEDDDRPEARPKSFTQVDKALQELGVDPGLRQIVISSMEGITDPGHQCSLGAWITRALKDVMAGRKQTGARGGSQISTEEHKCLWEFITTQELLKRQDQLSLQSLALVPASQSTRVREAPGINREWIVKEQKKLWLKLQELYLENAKIVLCTASTAGRKALRGFWPSYLVIEEASQMVESQALNGIMRNLKGLKKVILSGDTAQLPPTVISRGSNECFNTERVSLFERLIRTGHPHVQLEVQYRMAPDICKHVSDTFYESKVTTHESCSDSTTAKNFAKYMVAWYNVEAGSSYFVSVNKSSLWRRKGPSTSVSNPEYVQFICDLCRKFTKAGAPEKAILVLSFYDEERRALSSLLHDTLGLKAIEVKSVDASQGSESGIVILSTTRPGGANSIGFVQDRQRQCVALSRSRDGLVVVGHENMANGHRGPGYESWQNLIRDHAAKSRLIRLHGSRDKVFDFLHITNKEWEELK